MNNLIYQEVFKKVVKLTTENETIKKYVKYVALLGSARYDEAIENYSDLDILFIFESNVTGAIAINVLEKLKNINDKLSSESNIEISFLPHTVFDLKEYVNFEYLIHYSWGEVVFGDKNSFKKIFEEITKEKYSHQKRKNLIYYNLIHARFNLLRKYISWNKNNKKDYNNSVLKLFIDNIIEICDWALIYKNIFEKNKRGIASKFIKEYTNIEHRNTILKALEIRSHWNGKKINEEETNLFLKEIILFIENIIEVIYGEHRKN